MPRYILIDTETTGLRWDEGHRVFEIGMVETLDLKTISREINIPLNPDHKLSEESMMICKVTDHKLAQYKFFADEADKFLNFIYKGHTDDDPTILIAHNAKFDIGFLNNELSLCNKSNLSDFQILDTVKIAKKLYPGRPASLNELCKRFKIDLNERDEKGHGALLDVKLLYKIFLFLIDGKTHDEIVNFNKEVEDFVGFKKRIKPLTKRVFKNIIFDEKMHLDVLEKIKCQNVW
ncbi:MAG: DNA polymerase III subunit epsilon [Alphaproteobacteria bacterium]|nr:DNA polymerase III subunit epsilon [Rickettsiales bacterium]